MLQALQERYGPQGFRVLGFPCNDFGAEEPDDLPTIRAFCEREYGVTYELFDKVHLREGKGRTVHPLYRWLTGAGKRRGPVSWNFEKFLIGRDGTLLGRWQPEVEPDDRPVIRAIEAALREPVPQDAAPAAGAAAG